MAEIKFRRNVAVKTAIKTARSVDLPESSEGEDVETKVLFVAALFISCRKYPHDVNLYGFC